MKKKKNGLLRAFWYICMAGVFALGLMTIISTGGGGGDDVGSGGGGTPTLLDVYDYFIDTDLAGEYLTISLTDPPDTFTISVKTLGRWLAGTFNRVTGAYTLESGAERGASIDSDVGDTLLGSFNITVIASLQIPPDNFPTAGSFEVEYGTDSTIVTVVDVPADGVTLSLNGGPAQHFTWAAFEDLFGSAADDWQQRASLSFLLLEFMFEQLDFVVETLGFIGDHEDELQQNITVTENCDAFPQGAAPQGFLEQGTHALTWQDSSGNGEVGGGDNFTWTFTDCWDNDPNDDFDDLINGTVNLGSYTEVVDGNNRVTRVGFESPEGVVFTNLVISEVEEGPPGTFTIDPNDDVTVNNGFTIVFTE